MRSTPAELLDMERRRGVCGGCAYDDGAAMSASGMKKTKGASEGGGTGDLGFGRGGSGDALIHSGTRGMADTAGSAGGMAATPCPFVQRLKEGRDGLGWYYSWWAKVHGRHSSFFVCQNFCLSFPFTLGT